MTEYVADRVHRMVVLIEMESGLQHAYEVTHPTVTISQDWDDGGFYMDYRYVPGPHYATINAQGVFRGLVRWADAFEDPALPPVRAELHTVEEPVDIAVGEVVEQEP